MARRCTVIVHVVAAFSSVVSVSACSSSKDETTSSPDASAAGVQRIDAAAPSEPPALDADAAPSPPATIVDARDASADVDANLPGWKLVWSDEFDGTSLDTTVWNATPDGHGGYNQELQYFNGPDTALVSGGQLHIAALTVPPSAQDAGGALVCWYGPCQYSSAQLDTIGKFSHQYGRFAARIKIPAGRAFWPAFWMLANTGGWPKGGEIDVMENVGMTPSTVYGTIHGPDTTGAAYAKGGTYNSPSGNLSGGYHVYAVEWSATSIKWYFDDQMYFSAGPSALATGDRWVWDEGPFYLLFDLAIGGDWPGNPDGGIPEPAEMTVDWVRVYDPG